MAGPDLTPCRGPERTRSGRRRGRPGGARARCRSRSWALGRGGTVPAGSRTVRTGWPAGKKEPGWRAFLRQYEDFMQVILLAAALVNQLVTGDTGTTVVLAGLTVFNAVIGLRQESKAEESVKALAQMMKTIARVRRDGQAVEIDAEELVPGDVVLVEAGNLVPADGAGQPRRDPGDRGGRPHRREPAGREVDRAGPGDGRPARRPDLHGVHEHLGHPRPRRADRHRHRHGHRDRPHRRHARQHRDQQDAPAEAARRAVQDHRVHRRRRARPGRAAGPGAGRVVRHAVRHRRRPRGRRDPDRAAGGGDRAALDGHPRDRPTQRHRQATARRGDAGLDLRDLLGQDRHPDPQQDDRTGARHPGPEPLHGLRRGLQHGGRDQPCRRPASRPRPVPAADGAVRRRRARRGQPDRGPHRGRAHRAGRQGRAGHRRDPHGRCRGSPRSRSTPTTSSWRRSTR